MPVRDATDPSPDQTSPSNAPGISRRRFLLVPASLVAAGVLQSITARTAWARAVVLPLSVHPEPRAGITADKILAPGMLKKEKARKLYDLAREIPEVLDGIHCYCECDEAPWNHRSLLSCFESDQAAGCYSCGAEARLVHRLHAAGKTLVEIRTAVDKQFA